MTGAKHLLLTVTGGYTASGLTDEKWQTTLRLGLFAGPSGNSAPLVGFLPDNWEPQAESISRTGTGYTCDGNWSIDLGLGASFSPDDFLIDQVAPAVRAWFEDAIHPSSVRVEQLKLYPIGPDGSVYPAPPYAQGSPCTYTFTSNWPDGTATASVLPLQIAVVASHRTPQTGRKGRGRMFLPGIASSYVGADGQISSTNRQTTAQRQATLLESLTYNDLLTGWHVRPIITGAPWSEYATITSVRVGSVPDTQRRRRNQVPEVFYTEAVAP